MKTLIVAGTWNLEKNENNKYGKKSGLIEKMYNILKEDKNFDITYFNGGYYPDLSEIIKTANNYNIIFWLANVDNDLPKIRNIKEINPYATVIGSKRNHYDYNKEGMEYSFVEILNKALIQRNNLTIEFKKQKNESKFKMLLFDPLGTSWYEGYDLNMLVKEMTKRIKFIITTRRENTFKVNGNIDIPDNKDFFSYVREVSEIFHNTIEHAPGVTKFLGNASFRGENEIIYVSRRDVDKSLIDKNNFVAAYLDIDNKVKYYGEYKPSKDTVVQTRLYKMFKNINFIVHSHCYAKDGALTELPVPCGALDEIDEILKVMKKYYNNNFNLDYYKFNLNGHGCLILGKNIEDMKQTIYITRHLPEKIKI